ncbi:MAG: hypothetical protein GXP53_11545 [Deltaproteobacteria bacterium]|nr:hypothetical protein [Deltaproteobacteria bacterium]
MTSKIIAGIAFKLFAIWLLVRTILSIPFIWQSHLMLRDFRSPEKISIVWPVIIFISLLTASLIAIKIIWSLGTKVVNELPDSTIKNESDDIERFLLQILGLYFFITSLATIPNHMLQYVKSFGDLKLEQGLWIFAEIFKLVVGLLLFAKVNAWLTLLKKLREF